MTFSEFKARYAPFLDPQQEAAVQSVDGPVLLLAVPGSGKTTVLVNRLGYMVLCRNIPPEQILTMTYTVAATADMRCRFARLFGAELAQRMEFRTINSVSARIIRQYETSLGRTAFALMTDEQELTALVGEIYRGQTQQFAPDSMIRAIRTIITYIKNMQLSEEEIESLQLEDVKIKPIYREYCRVMRERCWMDYDDQMVYAYRILRKYPSVLRFFQQSYSYLCVDEAQDTSKIQHQIIRLLSGSHGNLFLVGDEDQSIYGFRAAYPEALLEFDQVYPHATVLLMEQNYRSTAQIVKAADRFIQRNQSRRPKQMQATRAAGCEIHVIDVADRLAQYPYLERVARSCQTETAVLYRNHDSALPLIDRMSRAGIPYRCRQFDGSFFTHRIVRDITDLIRFAYDPQNGALFLRIYYKLNAGIPKVAAEAAARSGADIWEALASSPELSPWARARCQSLQTHWSQLLQERADQAVYRIVHRMGYGDYLDFREADTSRIAILEAIGAAEPNPMRLLYRLDELALLAREGSAGPDCPFILSTIHASKGLEYETVYLMDVADDIFPACPVATPGNASAEDLQAYEEERRLFYVGMTRAKERLSIFRFRQPSLHSTFTQELFPKEPKPAARPTPKLRRNGPFGKVAPSEAEEERIRQSCAEFVPGCAVTHARFGEGTILEQQGDIASILFDDGSVKRFSLTVALQQKQLVHREK